MCKLYSEESPMHAATCALLILQQRTNFMVSRPRLSKIRAISKHYLLDALALLRPSMFTQLRRCSFVKHFFNFLFFSTVHLISYFHRFNLALTHCSLCKIFPDTTFLNRLGLLAQREMCCIAFEASRLGSIIKYLFALLHLAFAKTGLRARRGHQLLR